MSFTFKKVDNFFTLEECEYLRNIMDKWHADGQRVIHDDVSPNSLSFPMVFNDELVMINEKVEEILGLELWPTYTYARIYNKGDDLGMHLDRPECEYSFTINLGPVEDIWPIHMRTVGSEEHTSFELSIGDGAFYKGTEIEHWRDQLKTDGPIYQAFFHYVDKNGPYADRKYDGQNQIWTRSIQRMWWNHLKESGQV